MARKPSLIARFFHGIWRTIVVLYTLLLLVVLVGVPLGIYFTFFYHPRPTVSPDSALVWAPVGSLTEQSTAGVESLVGAVFSASPRQSVVRNLITALDRARHDKRIKLAFLKLDSLGAAEPGQVQDLDAAIDRFKHSGKPVVAWSDAYDQAQYEIASHADKVAVDPMGYVFLTGYGVSHLYYKDALDKLGVQVNVFRVGKYKSFAEPFTRNNMSPAARKENKAWMNSLWRTYRKTVSARHQVTPQAVNRYIDHFADHLQHEHGDTARLAQQAGLVDKVATLNDVRRNLGVRIGAHAKNGRLHPIDQTRYLQATGGDNPAPDNHKRIALVVVEGDIIDGASVPGSAGGQTIARLITAARHDQHVKAMLLRVNSPGGSITGAERIRRAVVATRAAGKPVVVSMAGLAASGGYWISMNANQIWAEPSTITGSIGVFGIVPTFAKTLHKLNIHTDSVGTTPLSNALNLTRPLSSPVKTFLQAGIEHAYNLFVSKVASARHMQKSAVKKIAQGRVWSGAAAARIGLVDHLGGLIPAEKAAAQLAGLKPNHYAVQLMTPPSSWRSLLRQFLTSHVRAALAIDPPALSWLRYDLNDPRGLYARCFCKLSSGAGTGARLGNPFPGATE